MTNSSRLTCSTSLLAMALLSCAASGCASMNGASEKWTAAWKKDTKPPGNDPNHEDVVRYWGQKKKDPKPVEMSPELKERLAKRSEERQTKSVADNLRDGNQRLKDGRLEESRRAFEQALAIKPDDADAHHGLAVIADKQQLFGVADNHYEAALKKQPRNPSLLNDIGYSHWLRGGDRQAEKMLLEALAVEPGHKGATLNLGTLYGKQGRFDEAYALLRKGATESETQQYMAKLFPQGRPSGAGARDGGHREQDFAMNQPSSGRRSAPPMPADDRLDSGRADSSRVDSSRMTMEQMRAELDHRQFETPPQRPSLNGQNLLPREGTGPREGSGPRSAWGDSLAQDQRPLGDPRQGSDPRPSISSHDSAAGQGSAANSYPGPGGQNGGPGGSQFQSGNSMLPYPGQSPGGFAQQEPQPSFQGFRAAPPQDSLLAAPGTKPHSNIPFWQEAPVVRGNSTSNPAPQQADSNSSPWGQQTSGTSPKIEQTNFTDEETRASRAAAQLGMNVGLGGMFSVLPSDRASAGSHLPSPPAAAGSESRFGGEFTTPPQSQNPGSSQYQNPSGGSSFQGAPVINGQNSFPRQNSGVQTTPFYSSNQDGSPNQSLIQLLGGSGAGSNSMSGNGASNRSRGTSSGWVDSTQQDSSANGVQIVPDSPTNSRQRPWDLPSDFGSTANQRGDLSSWGQSNGRGNTSSEPAPAEGTSGRSSRYAKAPWDESSIQPNSQSGGSRPFNGAWPSGGAQSAGAGSNTGTAPNAIPLWNGGSNAGQPMQNGLGAAFNGAPSGDSPPQWPLSQGR